MIYLDNASTTKVNEKAIIEAEKMLREEYFNPSTQYLPSINAKKKIEHCRKVIADKLGAASDRLIFTAGATESNSWVFASAVKNKKGNIVISAGEHPSVYENALLLKSAGTEVRIAGLTPAGGVDEKEFASLVDENTTLVSVIHCSNETGSVNDIAKLAAITKSRAPRSLFHSDGTQSLCKIPVNFRALGIDLYSVSAHKIGGMKGIGALLIKNGIMLKPLLPGGGQESGFRSGTENTAGIAAFSAAVESFLPASAEVYDLLYRKLSGITDVLINGDRDINSGYILSLSAVGVKAEILQSVLSDKGIYVGLGSACSSKKADNRVLRAMGRSQTEIEGNIRISISGETTIEEADFAAAEIVSAIEKLKR